MPESAISKFLRTTAAGRAVAPAAHRAREIALAGRATLEDRKPEVQERIGFLSRNQPLPPPLLRVKVQRNAGALNFLNNGRHQYAFMQGALERIRGINEAAGKGF